MQGFAYGIHAALTSIAMQHDIFDHYDRIIDNEADGRREATERHQVEALTDEPQRQDRHGDRHRNDQAGDERGAPVAQK